MAQASSRRRPELFVFAAFVIVQVVAPFLIGEVYPFTISPMFSDSPSCYCVYRVSDPAGKELDPARFGLHLVYDGNPPGFGVGICPRPTQHAFGEMGDPVLISQKVRALMDADPDLPGEIRILQQRVHGGEEQLKIEEQEWTVNRTGQQ